MSRPRAREQLVVVQETSSAGPADEAREASPADLDGAHGARRSVLAPQLFFARTAASRMRGLLGRGALEPGEALWIEPCNSIHTFFMRFAIDAAFLDREGRVVKLVSAMPPWRATRLVFRARAVVELGPGLLERAGVRVGDHLRAEAL